MNTNLKMMKALVCLLLGAVIACNSQSKVVPKDLVGGGCDGCELMYVGIPDKLSSIDTCRAWKGPGQKLLVTGKVYQHGGAKPASEVILYYWHTDIEGRYTPAVDMDERAKRHGMNRGWVKTDHNGNYSIYTIRPASYPNREVPAHIHLSVKEPDLDDEYYVDNIVFSDDVMLTGKERKALKNRGGSGIVRILKDDELQIAHHNIVLGLNIPNYPSRIENEIESGLEVGQESPSFTPTHAFGPDKGSIACPVCKYGRYNGILYFVGNHPDWTRIEAWLSHLEELSALNKEHLKVYFVYGNTNGYSKSNRIKQLEQIGEKLSLNRVALTFVPSFKDEHSEVHFNKINSEVRNTFIVYSHRKVVAKFVNLEPTVANFEIIAASLESDAAQYFQINELHQH